VEDTSAESLELRAAGRSQPARASLRDIAWVFLKLGTVAFGGPAAHVAMMRDEVVRRRGWLTDEAFLDYLGATNLIPGPDSTELAIHVGRDQAGWRGLLVAGACFIVPAALIVTAAAWAYVRFGSLPQAAGLLYGMKPVVIAVVLQALWSLGRAALRTRWLTVVAIAACAAAALGVNELAVLGMAGAVCAVRGAAETRRSTDGGPASARTLALPLVAPAAGAAAPMVGLWALFGVFLKVGAVLFGSGYVLLAFLRADLVQRLHWITERQLLDAVAVGQVTPGPVFTTATFVGYLVARGPGAAVATVGIFLPAFVFVAASGWLLPRLRRSPVAGAALGGVNAASMALMAVVTAELGRAALVDAPTIALAAVSAVLLLRYRVNSAWMILGGAAVGLLM
jgi:chromate transporter